MKDYLFDGEVKIMLTPLIFLDILASTTTWIQKHSVFFEIVKLLSECVLVDDLLFQFSIRKTGLLLIASKGHYALRRVIIEILLEKFTLFRLFSISDLGITKATSGFGLMAGTVNSFLPFLSVSELLSESLLDTL